MVFVSPISEKELISLLINWSSLAMVVEKIRIVLLSAQSALLLIEIIFFTFTNMVYNYKPLTIP